MQFKGAEKASIVNGVGCQLLRLPLWFWLVMVMGAVIRLYLVVFTEGTRDVSIWQGHANRVREIGLIRYYHENPLANHPPFISVTESFVLRAANVTRIPFRILLRMPFALIDAGTVMLLLSVLRHNPRRLVLAAAYWLHPLAMLLSSYHGNTDDAVAFFILLCVWLLSKKNTMGGAIALGASLWIKLPGVLAIPALLLLVEGWRKKLVFLSVAGLTAIATYLPALLQDPRIVYANVFGYHGKILKTTAGVPVWGIRVLLSAYMPHEWPKEHAARTVFLLNHSWQIAIVLLLLLTWLRRTRCSPSEVCATIAAGYTLVYGLTDYWAFQYFAWSVPFWFFLPTWFLVFTTILAGGYIYSLYWFLCGNPWLLGKWDFVGHPHWPDIVIEFRDLAMLFFAVSACWFVISAAAEQIKPWLLRITSRATGPQKPGGL